MSGWLTYRHDGTAFSRLGRPSLSLPPVDPPTDPTVVVAYMDLPADLPADLTPLP